MPSLAFVPEMFSRLRSAGSGASNGNGGAAYQALAVRECDEYGNEMQSMSTSTPPPLGAAYIPPSPARQVVRPSAPFVVGVLAAPAARWGPATQYTHVQVVPQQQQVYYGTAVAHNPVSFL